VGFSSASISPSWCELELSKAGIAFLYSWELVFLTLNRAKIILLCYSSQGGVTKTTLKNIIRRINSSFFTKPSFFTRWELSFFQILKSFPDPVLVTDSKGSIYYVNPSWEKLTGYSSDEAKGRNPRFLKTSKTNPKVFTKIWRTLKNGRTFSSEDMLDKKKNGHEYQIHSVFFPIIENKESTYYVQVLHDITKRKASEAMKNETLRLVSHELKTPITVAKLFLSRIQKKDVDGVYKSLKLDVLDKQVDILNHLINNMLDISKIESEKMELNIEKVNLTELIRQSIRKTNLLMEKKVITLDLDKKIEVMGDPFRLDQVVTNLINNAIKYSPAGSVIKVKVIEVDKKVLVSITDKGKGIAKSNLKKIFKKYFQVHKGRGMGLGLAISKEIIRRHKGSIWATSKLNKGSTFFFSLPTV
jgi:PAS domain S-box-containing protein